jgi:hypothetical protein
MASKLQTDITIILANMTSAKLPNQRIAETNNSALRPLSELSTVVSCDAFATHFSQRPSLFDAWPPLRAG